MFTLNNLSSFSQALPLCSWAKCIWKAQLLYAFASLDGQQAL